MNSSKPIRVVQITDCHLHASLEGTLLGLNTQESLDRVLESVYEESPEPDVLLATGDISQDYSELSYQRFFDRVRKLGQHFRWCPGNHDKKELMQKVGAETDVNEPSLLVGGWHILLLDTAVPGQVPGNLAQSQLDLAAERLAKYADRPTLITFHHQPVPMGSEWIDQQKIANGTALLEIVAQHDQVKALLWGHVHQERQETYQHYQLISTPSTCVQFTPKSKDFDIDKLAPGYRILDLYPDGKIETKVIRVEGFDFNIDYSVKGY